ncbi:MAG: CHAT domain-containing protein [Planctomycetes bacterium]|nr:CHAT domain-containing protein [Planctomycetota bacterium]
MKQVLLSASNDGTLKSVRFLHFATHAFVDESRPYLCGLVLSPPFPVATEGGVRRVGLDPPVGELDKLLRRAPSDGTRPELLTLHELAGLDLRSELVVLSACQSLGGRAIEGDWINGLARSFLIAGSSGVLCTLWETGDKVSSSVVPAIYHAILDTESAPGRSDVPRALQDYKKSMLRSPSHGHPAHWASFIYHGRIWRERAKGK